LIIAEMVVDVIADKKKKKAVFEIKMEMDMKKA
jgi:hypothetical protein